jgi:hypothetical protein
MANSQRDEVLDEFLEVRMPGVDYAEHQHVEPLQIDVDLTNFVKFPRVDDSVVYAKDAVDYRADLVERGLDLPDYSGPFRADLSFMDFSVDALVRMLSMSHDYYALLIAAWYDEIAARQGVSVVDEIQASVWTNGVLPQVPRIAAEFGALDDVDTFPSSTAGAVVTFNPFHPDSRYAALGKEQLVALSLGCHEFLLLVIECWAAEVVVRFGLDEMFSIQWALWSEKVLPEVRNIKGRWMNITSNDVAAFMKDIQVDATSFPGKAFEMTFEMPEEDVGIMTFNRCCAVDQWEALGRPDILEKNCHSTCPASLIETAKMYNANMKVDILAIPPRVESGNVCCKWKLSMRDENDPEYVAVELGAKPA